MIGRALLLVFLCIAPALADGDRIASETQADYRTVRGYLIRAAEEMPGADYSFRPSPEVRTFGQQIAHIADDQYNLCAPARGLTRKAAYSEIEHTLSAKAELVPALKDAFAYCDAAYAMLTAKNAGDIVPFANTTRSRISMLNWNVWHTFEHYGNLVVYLRIKGLVPPSSAKN